MLSVVVPSDSNVFLELLQLNTGNDRVLQPLQPAAVSRASAIEEEGIFRIFESQAMLPLHTLQKMQGLRPCVLLGVPLQDSTGSKARHFVHTGSLNDEENTEHGSVDTPSKESALIWEAPLRCDSPNLPFSAVPCPLPPGHFQTTDEHLAEASLHVLLGCSEIIPRLVSGTLQTQSIRPAALQAIARSICEAGLQRAFLSSFLHGHGISQFRESVDPEQHALVVAVQVVLEQHSRMLWNIIESVRERREQESPEHVEEGFKMEPLFPTLLEVLQHTRSLRRQIHTLATLCWCCDTRDPSKNGKLRWQAEPFPRGYALLEHLHAGMVN
jgi:hypothetical protein